MKLDINEIRVAAELEKQAVASANIPRSRDKAPQVLYVKNQKVQGQDKVGTGVEQWQLLAAIVLVVALSLPRS